MAVELFDQLVDRRGSDSLKWDGQYLAGGDLQGLPMWVADADFQVYPAVLAAIRERLDAKILGYSLYQRRDKELICEWIARRHCWQINPDWLLPVTSTMAAMAVAVEACSSPTAGIVIQEPVYPPFFRLADRGRRLYRNRLIWQKNGYQIDFQQLEQLFAQPDVAIFALCHPHNPGGRNWTVAELERLAALCLRYNIKIICDAIHCDLVLEPGARYYFPDQLVPELNSISVFSLNKAFNIPGISHAVAIIADAATRRRFAGCLQHFHLDHVNALAQVANRCALAEGDCWLNELLVYLRANQRYLLDFVASNLPLITALPSQASYLSWLDCRRVASEDQFAQTLTATAKLTLSRGSVFGDCASGFFRLNFACPRRTLQQGLQRLLTAYNLMPSTI